MASREVSWQSAFWSLPPLAINSMMQPSGRVCGFDPSLRTYLRASPIVCAFDAVTIIIRFVAYSCRGLSAPLAAKKVISARGDRNEDIELGGIRGLEQALFLRCVWFVIGSLPQVIKLMACSGLPWTQVWGCFYLVSFIFVEVMNTLSESAELDVEELGPAGDDPLEQWIGLCDKVCGTVAVLLQLFLLAWIDMAVKPPDPILIRRWTFRFIRLSAHFAAFLIHLPFSGLVTAVQSDAPMELRNNRLRGFVVSMLVIFCLLLAGFEGHHFSYMYFMFSIISAFFAWLLYFIPVAKTHVLLCEPGNRRDQRAGYWNVLVFDFFCRILGLSLFWYAQHYNPIGTFKPEWAEVLG